MTTQEKIQRALAMLPEQPENHEVARQFKPERELDWYQRTRPAAGDRSDWGGAAYRGKIGREEGKDKGETQNGY